MRKIMSSAAFWLFMAGGVSAHSWYDSSCCSDKDCAPIPFEAVRVTEDGYEVTLMPGEHPMVRKRLFQIIPFGSEDILQSQDMQYHACVIPGSPTTGIPYIACFYVVGAGT
jgi:hypothetical protein